MLNVSVFRPVLERTLDHALRYLEALDRMPVAATASGADLRARLLKPLSADGMPAERVIDDLVADVAGGLNGTGCGRFYGWVIGGSVPAATAADWLTTAWDQNSGLFAVAPAEAIVEEACGVWLKDLLKIPAAASFALVTGCQMAHTTCLAAARNALLARRGWDVERQGLIGAPRIRVVTSDQRHNTIDRSLRLLGLGTDALVLLPAGSDGRLEPDVLRKALDPSVPTIVVLQAGDLNIGAYDPFASLIPIAHDAGAWVHVDGAFGLWVAADPERAHLLNGAERADSWAVDGHKWLNVPFDAGYAFVADPSSHRAAMSVRASYLVHGDEVRDQLDWNPEFSRRGRGFATYAAIRQLGRSGIAQLISRSCVYAQALVTQIGALEGAEMLWEPQINQGLVRFLDRRTGATPADHDRRTDQVIAAILKTGEALFSGTTWRGMRCMRVSVCNWQTSQRDVDRVVEAVRKVLSTS